MHLLGAGIDLGKVQTVTKGSVRNSGATIWIKWWFFKFTVYLEKSGLIELKKRIEDVIRKLPG